MCLTGKTIGYGAYGSVKEVKVSGAFGAAKFVRQDSPHVRVTEFLKECQLMSTLRHQNIVQFLGIANFPEESQHPALIMEQLVTSLDDVLDPDTDAQAQVVAYFPLSLKFSILYNVACGLAYLHERSPPVIHRDLSARNVLLDSSMVAKISDFGVAVTKGDAIAMSPSTSSPIYMPPEGSKNNNGTIDIFSFGILTMFTIGETFPSDPLPATYTDPDTNVLLPRPELEKHSMYMQHVKEKLSACGQLLMNNPFIQLIQQCLQCLPAKRPGIREVLLLLEEGRVSLKDDYINLNKLDLVCYPQGDSISLTQIFCLHI